MTEDNNKAIFRRLVEEVINPGKLDWMDGFVDPHFVDHYPPMPGRASGVEGFKQGFAALRSAFPDLRLTIEDMISEGEKVSFRITLHGTHLGAFAGIPPTGRAVTWPAVGIMLISEGKIMERWLQSDATHLMKQLGADPSSG